MEAWFYGDLGRFTGQQVEIVVGRIGVQIAKGHIDAARQDR